MRENIFRKIIQIKFNSYIKQLLGKTTMISLLKYLIHYSVVILFLVNGLIAYADEQDDPETLYEYSTMLESLKEQLSTSLKEELAYADKQDFDEKPDNNRVQELRLLEKQWQSVEAKWSKWDVLKRNVCNTQNLQAVNQVIKLGNFKEGLQLFEQLLKGNCPDDVITITKKGFCQTLSRFASKKVKLDNFAEALQLYHQVIEGNCQEDLVNNAKDRVCLTLFKQAEKQMDTDDLIGASQSYKQVLEANCQNDKITKIALGTLITKIGSFHQTQQRFEQAIDAYKTVLSFAKKYRKEYLIDKEIWQLVKENICLVINKQAEKMEKAGDSDQAMQFYHQTLKEDCPRVKEHSKKMICLTPLLKATKQEELGNLTEALQLYQQVLEDGCQNKQIIDITLNTMFVIGHTYETQHRLETALEIYEYVIFTAEKLLGKEYLIQEKWQSLKEKLCLTQYQRAEEHRKEKVFTKASKLYQRVLEGNCQNKVFIHNSLSHLITIGFIYENEKQRLDQALNIYRKALYFTEKFFGKNENWQILTKGICLIKYQQADQEKADEQIKAGNLPKALQLYQQVLEEKECQDDKMMIEVVLISIMKKIGIAYEKQQHFVQANNVYQKVLSIAENTFEKKHKVVSLISHKLANLSYQLSNYTYAKKLWEDVLVIDQEIYGLESSEVANILIKLAKVNGELDKHAQAKSQLKQALTIYEQIYKSEYDKTDIMNIMMGLASLYVSLGYYTQAESLLKSVLDNCEKTYSSENIVCVITQESISIVQSHQGKFKDAESLLKWSRTIKENFYGLEHPSVGDTLRSLANFYASLGDYAKAELLFKRVRAIKAKAYPPKHPEIAETLSDLATMIYKPLGEYDHAETLLKEVCNIYEKYYGPQHTQVAKALSSLADIYEKQGDYEQAKSQYQRALVIYEKIYGPQHAEVAGIIDKLALIHLRMGDYIYASSLAVLHFLAAQGEGAIVNQVQLAANFPEQLDASLQNLLQRELIEIVEDGGYRIQVELIRRWFTKERA
jgi:tetratricopeptide (TPR) repeat protein